VSGHLRRGYFTTSATQSVVMAPAWEGRTLASTRGDESRATSIAICAGGLLPDVAAVAASEAESEGALFLSLLTRRPADKAHRLARARRGTDSSIATSSAPVVATWAIPNAWA
jgi:hypothetical protein